MEKNTRAEATMQDLLDPKLWLTYANTIQYRSDSRNEHGLDPVLCSNHDEYLEIELQVDHLLDRQLGQPSSLRKHL